MPQPGLKKVIIFLLSSILSFLIWVYRKFKSQPAGIYFCYNQSIHHIYHSLFIAIELSNLQNKYPVVILSTSFEASEIIEKELSTIANNVKFIKIRHPGYNKISFQINWFAFWCRLYIDKPKAVIVTDYFDNILRKLGLKTFWVFVGHGLENRGYYCQKHLQDYDLVTLPGESDLEQIQKRLGEFRNYSVIGYSKFDYFYYHQPKTANLFSTSKPVIIYNPHFDESLSSFFDQGVEFLKALSNSNKYNIIFMPHPDLARKYPKLIQQAQLFSNLVLISRPKINLDYLALSDLYITDLSSAVFEWLYFNKPVLFFNPQGNSSYPSYVLGRVSRNIPEMLVSIEEALKFPHEFQVIRDKIFQYSFVNLGQNVSKLIAGLIWEKVKN